MVDGEVVNASEKRQALHTSLRSEDINSPHYEEVNQTRERMYALARAVREGSGLEQAERKLPM